jgi:hypothetical protein
MQRQRLAPIIVFALCCTGVAVIGNTPSARAQNADDGDQGDAVAEMVKDLDAEIAALVDQQRAIDAQIRGGRIRAAEDDQHWKSIIGRIESSERIETDLKNKRHEAESAAQAAKDAAVQVEQAEAAMEAAKKALDEARQAATKAEESVAEAEKSIASLQQQWVIAKEELPGLKLSAVAAESARAESMERIANWEFEATALRQQQRHLRGQIESTLKEAERWVSFADQIAPVFHRRCVSCHNDTVPEGQYSMGTYESILGQGQSGTAIEPGEADLSPLFQHVADGWMPLESDPLTSEEVALIGRWIDSGARLDVAARADDPLIRIMPRPAQPAAPESYAFPIPVTALAVDPSGRWLVTSGYHELLLWSLPDGQFTARIPDVAQRVYGIDFHPEGHQFAVASGTPGRYGEVQVFDMASRALVKNVFVASDSIFDVRYSPGGDRIAAAGADGSLVILDPSKSDPLVQSIHDHSDWITRVAWSPDGGKIATASRDKTAKVVDASSGKLLLTFNDHQEPVTTVAFLSEGDRIVSGGGDQRLRVWKTTDGDQTAEIKGLPQPPADLAIDQRGRVVSVCQQGMVRFDNLQDKKKLAEFSATKSWVCSLAISPIEPVIYVGDQDGQVTVIDAENFTVLRSWIAIPSPKSEPQSNQ